jgi:hypothetical protein
MPEQTLVLPESVSICMKLNSDEDGEILTTPSYVAVNSFLNDSRFLACPVS